MGEVYKAHETCPNRKVAIKIPTDRLAADPQFRDGFEREDKQPEARDKHMNVPKAEQQCKPKECRAKVATG